ncbi:MAG: hypothetical protein KVP17_000556 [Porospora cf. gigantea B]|uniref:uncharacterized protein n=1 Tax=Porospora cf. gigantea B TaxID=2853592 RepID=UPI003571E0B6|nr:MAG: hypothetical protein KVP17_000556 [Porospora cf. gigantea B]
MLEWATEAHIVDIPSFLWTYQGKTFIVEHHDIDRVAVEVISSQTVAQHVDKSLDLTQFKVPAVEFRITSEQAAQLAGELLKDRLWLLAFFVSGNESDTLRMVQQGPFGPIERRVDYFTQIDSKALSTLIDRWRFPVVLQAHAEHLRLVGGTR